MTAAILLAGLVNASGCADEDDAPDDLRQARDADEAAGASFTELGCNPLASRCDPGSSCHDLGGDPRFVCVMDDLQEIRPEGLGGPCRFGYECQEGLVCSQISIFAGCKEGGFGCCAQLCDLSDEEAPCPTGSFCVPYFDAAPPSAEFLGICAN